MPLVSQEVKRLWKKRVNGWTSMSENGRTPYGSNAMLGALLRRNMPDLDSESLYRALLAKDTRFDGRFFVGVATTGVYCRPVCRARKPLAVNCSFYATAAEAEQAGFRPCLLCRPELAPGYAPVDSSASLARAAARYIERNCGIQGSLTDIARHLGCSNRHLRRVFEDAYHVRPVEYRQTCRLLLAKSLLTDTDLSVVDVAYSAGFGSLRRFNEVFRRRYRLTPTALRSQARLSRTEDDAVQLSLGYRPPYRWDLMLKFLARRAIPGVEKVEEGRYARTIRLRSSRRDLTGWVTVGNDAEHNRLAVTVSASLLPALPAVLDGIKNLFDLHCEPDTVARALTSMDESALGPFIPGIRVPGCFDAFETAVLAVLGQQVTIQAARTLAGRLVQALGSPVDTEIDGLTMTFPMVQELLNLDSTIEQHLGPLGIITARARAIHGLAAMMGSGIIDAFCCPAPEAAVARFMEIPGIGAWTAGYIAMRCLAWPDAFLATDLEVRKALGSPPPGKILTLADRWKPWRAYAVMHLWNRAEAESVSEHATKSKKWNEKKEAMHYLSHYESPLGAMTMASDGHHLTGLWFDGQKYDRSTIDNDAVAQPHLPVFTQTAQWLNTYFEGADPGFTPPIRVEGSDFKKMVTSIMLSIPFGATSTYAQIAAEVARRTGRKQMSAQAVGGAVGRNPIVLIVPCHRVVATNGSLRGYAGGVNRKEWLLEMEGVNVSGLLTPPAADDGGETREREGRPRPRSHLGESR